MPLNTNEKMDLIAEQQAIEVKNVKKVKTRAVMILFRAPKEMEETYKADKKTNHKKRTRAACHEMAKEKIEVEGSSLANEFQVLP
jgi:hypothetical protein